MAFLICRPVRARYNSAAGQAIMEFIPVVLVMLAVAFSVIDVSRAVWQVQVIKSLTREGANLASRSLSSTPCADTVTTLLNDGSNINLNSGGAVIVTQIQNLNGSLIIGQQAKGGTLTAKSQVGSTVGKAATVPTESPQIPTTNNYLYAAEVFSTYTPITPVGAFAKSVVLPSTLYDIAYF